MPAPESSVKTILLLVGIAIVSAVVVTLAQQLILGKTNVAITGAVVGATVITLGLSAKRKRAS